MVFWWPYSPEREDPGNTSIDRRDIPKVVGGLGNLAAEAAGALYNTAFRRVVRVSSPAAAEMTKLLENIYRCVNIALVNELKLLCLRMGIDIWEVIGAAATKPFGFQPFYPGPGLGGHCIPIDPFYLSWKAKEFDFSTRFIELAGEVDKSHAVSRRGGSRLGAKPARQAPQRSADPSAGPGIQAGRGRSAGISVARRSSRSCSEEGAQISYNDPFFPAVGRGAKVQSEHGNRSRWRISPVTIAC